VSDIAVQVQRLDLNPGDLALIQVKHNLTAEMSDYLREQIRCALPNNKAHRARPRRDAQSPDQRGTRPTHGRQR
jgi:hypothetical protein